jgi:hypothetical protein
VTSGNQFEEQTNRPLEVTCGVVLLAFAVLLGIGAVVLPIASQWNKGALVAALIAALSTWGLGTLGIRLVLGRRRVNKELFSPTGLTVSAGLFALAGAGVTIIGVLERRPQAFASGLSLFVIAYYAWRVAQKRRRLRRDA